MPTEDMKQEMGEAFVMTEDGKRKEIKDVTALKTINNFKKDSQKEFKKYLNKETERFELTREEKRRIEKMFGIQKITRKRFIKLLMSCGFQRNKAMQITNVVHKIFGFYIPITVQIIIEIILEECEETNNGK